MKIAIVGINKRGGGYMRMKFFEKFLTHINHDVELIFIPQPNLDSKFWYYSQSGYNKYFKNPGSLFKSIGKGVEKIIKKKNYDAVIGMETKFSYFLTKDIDCLKIFSCQSLEADERLFSKKFDLKDIKIIRDIEIEIMEKSDYVLFPWKTTENYVRKFVYNGKNLMTLQACCDPKNGAPSYFYPVSIVSLGNLGFEWANVELLSHLTKKSPYIIDSYGRNKPKKEYEIRHKGYAKSLNVLYNYQFGLNTVSKDPFRRNHFSSRILNYLNYGLPVLYPEWQIFPKELKGCIPYNEENFLDVLNRYSEREEWEKIKQDAISQSHKLDWKITLKPLEKIIEKI